MYANRYVPAKKTAAATLKHSPNTAVPENKTVAATTKPLKWS